MAGLRNEWRETTIEANDVDQISDEPKQLGCDQGNMRVAREKNLRPGPNQNCRGQVQKKYRRQKKTDVEPLIAPDSRGQAITCLPRTVAHARINQAKIVNKQSPADCDERGSETKPARGLANLSK